MTDCTTVCMGEELITVQIVEEVLSTKIVEEVLAVQLTELVVLQTGEDFAQEIAGETLGSKKLVCKRSDEKVYYPDNTDLTTKDIVIGLTTTSAAAADDTLNVLREGEIEDAIWSWTPGKSLFVGSAGLLTQTKPLSGYLLNVGSAITATKININIRTPTTLV